VAKRREFPKSVKLAAWQRCGGACEACGSRLFSGKFIYDHDKPDTFGGEPSLGNCVVRCTACDKKKTYGQDIPNIAKSNRQREKHLGLRKAKGRPMPGTKASGIRKRMSGRVEKW
jgi:hypothetical protein